MCIAFEKSRIPQSRGFSFVSCALFRPTPSQEKKILASASILGSLSTPVQRRSTFFVLGNKQKETRIWFQHTQKNIIAIQFNRTFFWHLFSVEKNESDNSIERLRTPLRNRQTIHSLKPIKKGRSFRDKLSTLRLSFHHENRGARSPGNIFATVETTSFRKYSARK